MGNMVFGSGPYMDKLSVGQVIPEMQTNDVTIQMHYRDPYWELSVGYPNITEEEIRELVYGDFHMAITQIEGLLFFLFSIGKIPWCDAPYEPRLTTKPMNYRTDFPEGEGAPLCLLVVDTATGVLKRIRVVGMGHSLSEKLHAYCREKDAERPFDVGKYDYWLSKLYNKYKTSESMLKTVNPSDIFLLINT